MVTIEYINIHIYRLIFEPIYETTSYMYITGISKLPVDHMHMQASMSVHIIHAIYIQA